MRAYTPGGRFDAEFETKDILAGINADLQRPVGTYALWWVFNPDESTVDPVYDVGDIEGGRVWDGPYKIPVVRAVITQGKVYENQRGYYNVDMLHLTLHADDIDEIHTGVIANPDLQNRGRIVWKNQIYRPFAVQQRGIIAERFTLLSIDCIQIMPEEMINEPQFQDYASP